MDLIEIDVVGFQLLQAAGAGSLHLGDGTPAMAALCARCEGSSPPGHAPASACDVPCKIRPPGCVQRPCALARAAFRCMRRRGSRALTGRGSNACTATWPDRPWRRSVCASSIRSGFPSRSKHRGRRGPAISCSLRWNYWRSWPPSTPAPAPSPALPRGPGPPGPGPRPHRARQTG